MSDIGLRLREAREGKGLSQEAFGALGGVSRNAQFTYETGKRAPDSDYLMSLRSAGVDVVYVLTGERRPDTFEAWQADVAFKLGQLDAEWRALIVGLVEKAFGRVPRPALHELERGYGAEPKHR